MLETYKKRSGCQLSLPYTLWKRNPEIYLKVSLPQISEAKGDYISGPKNIVEIMTKEAQVDRECFWVLHLDTKHQVIEKELVHIGTLNRSTAHPREIFKKAIINSCDGIITIHNHPGNSAIPSREDTTVWRRLRDAGEILGIDVLDNMIITPCGKYFSELEGESKL